MHTVDKQGVRLEQCQNCRGIFLDPGELEQILMAEQRYYGDATSPYAAPHAGHHGHPDSPRAYRDRRGHGSFLGDLFG
jgi:Zn-finger nucleic acid-binding protein